MAKKTNDTKQPEKIYQDIDAKFLGRMLKYRREAARMTQQEAADKIGLSLSYYKNMERGSNNPRFPQILFCFLLWKTATILHISRLSVYWTDALNLIWI